MRKGKKKKKKRGRNLPLHKCELVSLDFDIIVRDAMHLKKLLLCEVFLCVINNIHSVLHHLQNGLQKKKSGKKSRGRVDEKRR